MKRAIKLTSVEVKINDGYIMIPHGMTPIHLHKVNGKMIAYVEGWTAAKEYDDSYFDLYLLDSARHFIVSFSLNDEATEQDWYDTFGEPTKEARYFNEELTIRER